ncbi:hypothetical protein VTJ83DRAFT_2760 [Remersonia thermophila]|uniref:BTB domain-containing protein n=1 Tax=Remersonia thermophila TaxID=72144 RepID=A0ABR4DL52_9PEZI
MGDTTHSVNGGLGPADAAAQFLDEPGEVQEDIPERPWTFADFISEMELDGTQERCGSSDLGSGTDEENDEDEDEENDEDEDEENTARDRRTSLYASLSALRLSEKWTDMTIRCGGREFQAHRAVVCTQSQFFDLALSGPFREAQTGVVDLPEDDPDILERFLEFLYTGTYQDDLVTQTLQDEVCLMSVDEIKAELNTPPGVTVDAATDAGGDDSDDGVYYPPWGREPTEFYGIYKHPEPEEEFLEGLEDAAADEAKALKEQPFADTPMGERLREIIDQNRSPGGSYPWSRSNEAWAREVRGQRDLFLPLRLYVMADKFGVPALKVLARNRFHRAAEHTWHDIEAFPELVDELYESTPPNDYAMREVVCRLAGSWAPNHPDEMERFGWVLKKHKEFATGVWNYMGYYHTLVWT